MLRKRVTWIWNLPSRSQPTTNYPTLPNFLSHGSSLPAQICMFCSLLTLLASPWHDEYPDFETKNMEVHRSLGNFFVSSAPAMNWWTVGGALLSTQNSTPQKKKKKNHFPISIMGGDLFQRWQRGKTGKLPAQNHRKFHTTPLHVNPSSPPQSLPPSVLTTYTSLEPPSLFPSLSFSFQHFFLALNFKKNAGGVKKIFFFFF